ncbi:MAG: hypothetical protein ACREID_00505 [Planctomycetota bacterium]
MPRTIPACLFLALLAGRDASAEERQLYNVEVLDAQGVETRLAAFYRVSGEDRFEGYRGSARIEIPYARMREFRLLPPAQPGGRMRAEFLLRTGSTVQATFDEREGELLFAGYAPFGRVRLFFRDMRRLRILGRTTRDDLPEFGAPGPGVDARAIDREGVETELVGLHRLAGETVLSGIRGSASVEVPLRIVRTIDLRDKGPRRGFVAYVVLRGGAAVELRVPSHERTTVFGGEAEFGAWRAALGDLRGLVIHRTTPPARNLDPVLAAEGEAKAEAGPPR